MPRPYLSLTVSRHGFRTRHIEHVHDYKNRRRLKTWLSSASAVSGGSSERGLNTKAPDQKRRCAMHPAVASNRFTYYDTINNTIKLNPYFKHRKNNDETNCRIPNAKRGDRHQCHPKSHIGPAFASGQHILAFMQPLLAYAWCLASRRLFAEGRDLRGPRRAPRLRGRQRRPGLLLDPLHDRAHHLRVGQVQGASPGSPVPVPHELRRPC